MEKKETNISKYFVEEEVEGKEQQTQEQEEPVQRQIVTSKDLEHYADSNCSKCYGRGHKGTVTEPGGRKAWVTCICAAKNYQKLKEKLKEQ